MSLTRSLLKELQISPDAAERIIAAHAESIDALRQERDAARGEAAQLESIRAALAEMTQARDEACQARDSAREKLSALGGQFDSYRQQVETEKHQQARHANLRAALQSAGANLTRWICCCLPSTPTKARLTATKSPTRTRCLLPSRRSTARSSHSRRACRPTLFPRL